MRFREVAGIIAQHVLVLLAGLQDLENLHSVLANFFSRRAAGRDSAGLRFTLVSLRGRYFRPRCRERVLLAELETVGEA